MAQNVVQYLSSSPSGAELLDVKLPGSQENFLTTNSGSSRPSYAKEGTLWIDTSETPNILKQYNGTDDTIIGYIDNTNKTFRASNGVDLTSEQTIDGVKTFTFSPIVPTATSDTQAVNKGQMDLKANSSDLTTGLATKANDSEVVKLTGDQTVSGVKTFENGYTGYANGQMTNCILSTGVNIQLTYDSTSVTCKSGSKLLYPDGSELILSQDLTTTTFSTDGIYLLLGRDNTSTSSQVLATNATSGSSGTGSSTYIPYYNYTDKAFYVTSSVFNVTIPYAQVTVESGVITAVEKLDTVSYFGEVRFGLPITVLCADGYNSDGTLKSVKRSYDLTQQTAQSSTTKMYRDVASDTNIGLNSAYHLDIVSNKIRTTTTDYSGIIIGSTTQNGTQVIGMTPVHPIRLADANTIFSQASSSDKEIMANMGRPDYDSVISFSSDTYTCPADGYITISGTTTSTGLCRITLSNSTANSVSRCIMYASISTGLYLDRVICNKGDAVSIDYNNITIDIRKFYYAQGAV